MSIQELLKPNNYDIFARSFTAPIINAQDSLIAEDIFTDTITGSTGTFGTVVATTYVGLPGVTGPVPALFSSPEHVLSSGATGNSTSSLAFLEFPTGDFNLGATGSDGFMKRVVNAGSNGWNPVNPLVQPGNSYVAGIVSDANYVYVAGGFTGLGGTIDYIAKWDGASYSAIDPSNQPNGIVHVVKVDPNTGDLYIGGGFTGLAGTINYIAKWDGVSWSAPDPANQPNLDVYAIEFDPISGDLHIGGDFSSLAGTVHYVAKLTAGAWAQPDAINQPNTSVACLGFDSTGLLYMGGYFTGLAGTINRIAKLVAGTWTAVDAAQPAGGPVLALTFNAGDNLYIGGSFTGLGGTIDRVAIYSGGWFALDAASQPNGEVTSVKFVGPISGPILYIGGAFTNLGLNSADYIAYMPTVTWEPVDATSQPNASVSYVGNDAEVLYIGGNFTDIGTSGAQRIAVYANAITINYNASDTQTLAAKGEYRDFIYNSSLGEWLNLSEAA